MKFVPEPQKENQFYEWTSPSPALHGLLPDAGPLSDFLSIALAAVTPSPSRGHVDMSRALDLCNLSTVRVNSIAGSVGRVTYSVAPRCKIFFGHYC